MKYSLRFKIVETENEAARLCEYYNTSKCRTNYIKKKYPAHYTKWHNDYGFVVWY